MAGKTETATERPKPKRRWFQYSLGTLLVFVTVSAIPCSWVSVKMRQAEKQREAATAIEKLGGAVWWDNKASGWPSWLRKLLGGDFFNSVCEVSLIGVKVTDAGLEHLKRLSRLQGLVLADTKITDAGLEHLKGLSQLQELYLDNTQVTDAGLEHLKRLSRLQALGLDYTQVTDEGVKKLQQALPKCSISHRPARRRGK